MTESMPNIVPGLYRHYKNKMYEVIDVVVHSETFEELVLYRSLEGSKEYAKGTLWVRPKKMFCENIVIDGKEVPRFSKS